MRTIIIYCDFCGAEIKEGDPLHKIDCDTLIGIAGVAALLEIQKEKKKGFKVAARDMCEGCLLDINDLLETRSDIVAGKNR